MTEYSSSVILFRDPDRDDSYTTALTPTHTLIKCVSVLEHVYLLDTSDIDNIVHRFGVCEFSALVFTSQTAVHALAAAASRWLNQPVQSRQRTDRTHQWSRILSLPIFVVGHATRTACESLLFAHTSITPDIRGDQSGQATNLLPHIIQFCKHHSCPKLLFVCGDHRRDTLPDGIQASMCADLVELVAYTTKGRDATKVREELCDAVTQISECRKRDRAHKIWMVVFSPSGARVVIPVLNNLVAQNVLCSPSADKCALTYQLAAIGPTTQAEIIALGINKDHIAVATTPTAQGIRQALQ
ncbi:hypothetical protein J3F81_001422 [Coemansia sp. RSA 371]|nr:hypothetical protein J3F81_001422 [Coemansia sp. RSA 371]